MGLQASRLVTMSPEQSASLNAREGSPYRCHLGTKALALGTYKSQMTSYNAGFRRLRFSFFSWTHSGVGYQVSGVKKMAPAAEAPHLNRRLASRARASMAVFLDT